MASAHSAHASPAGRQCIRAGRTAGVTAMVLAARTSSPPPSIADHVPVWPASVPGTLRTTDSPRPVRTLPGGGDHATTRGSGTSEELEQLGDLEVVHPGGPVLGAVVAGVLGGLGDLVALDRQEQVDQLLAEQAAQHRVLLQLVQGGLKAGRYRR